MMDLNVEDVSSLTDDQLFASMKRCGLTVGPITGTTRSLYERKFRNFLEGKGNVTINAPSSGAKSAAVADENKPVQQKEAVMSKSTMSAPKKPAAEVAEPQAQTKAAPPASSIPVREKSRERTRAQLATTHEPVLRDTINRVTHTEEVKMLVTERPAPQVYAKPASTFVRSSEDAMRQERVTSSQMFAKPVQPSTTTLAYAASTITTTNLMPERSTQLTEKPHKLPQPSFASSSSSSSSTTSPFGADLGAAFTNPLRNYDSPSLFRDKDRDAERFDNFLSGTKSSTFATSTLRRNEPIPTPIKDKFAERLNNYGLLKTDPSELGGGVPLQTPLRNRTALPEKTPLRTEPAKQHLSPAKDAPKDKSKQVAPVSGSPVNFKYLIIAVVATIVVYLIAIQFQSNPVNPVEI